MYQPKNPIRIVTAASLFDGHDASINIMRRMLQDAGAEVIHLGHNRSVRDIVMSALQESAQGIAISSYQGGHMEFFKYAKDLLRQYGAPYVKIYGGGGGVIVHEEKRELEEYGIDHIFHPDEGRRLGLEGMIEEIIRGCDYSILDEASKNRLSDIKENEKKDLALGLAITSIELGRPVAKEISNSLVMTSKKPIVVGITGTGGAGKSSLIDELLHRLLHVYPDKKIGVFCVDPSKRKTGGALLGDRIRMNALANPRTFMRSLASRGSGQEVSVSLPKILEFAKNLDFDLIIAETSGIGQSGSAITELCDLSLYVMTSEFGAQSQLEKIDMIDFADLIAINKADRRGAHDALRDVRKQYRRSRKLFTEHEEAKLPVYLTQASHFNDTGVNELFFGLSSKLEEKSKQGWGISSEMRKSIVSSAQQTIIPSERQNYLAEIVSTIRKYKKDTEVSAQALSRLGALENTKTILKDSVAQVEIEKAIAKEVSLVLASDLQDVKNWDKLQKSYSGEDFSFEVRGKEIKQKLTKESLSGIKIRRVSLPRINDLGDRLRFLRLENVPGSFPYTAGVFPLKREEEDPKRQFAGEGTPERTNRRFHYLSKNDKAKRLSTAFDSVTLYGEDPDLRPDIYGKVGESGVSICTLNDMKKLYDGFDLISPFTSVSMTINGPAPMILAFYMNTATDQQVRIKEKELGRTLNYDEWSKIRDLTLTQVRGTVQADILKEDQAQNTCIFSTDFALKMMGDMQEYFIKKDIRNFYSVSISGYHIAEAGANPISQLAFTLANGFTYVEYYLARGMKIDEFAPNLSFFFSNGLDPEYSVLGRVARRIWAVAMRDLYGANDRSQKLKYHIQTSGRSLHAQEIDFNDIRTTLQALIAVYDNCNSLHTNAYDEAITTPTEESVRRAMAIQMIINKEFGVTKNENPTQGAYFTEELTELVEEAVLDLFSKLNERGGVLGAMETQFQRSRIQDESMYYEHLKHSGVLPVVGVNTFADPKTLEASYVPPKIKMARATADEKQQQLNNLKSWQKQNKPKSEEQLKKLKEVALSGENIFEALMEASRYCSLGQMSQALYSVGGQYRRNL